MKIIQVKNYEELSKKAAQIIIEKVQTTPEIKLGLATGETPEGMYQYIIEDHKMNGTSYDKITTFNLDEYVGLSSNYPNSYRHYMNTKLFNHINVMKSRTHIPHGDIQDGSRECIRYEELIEEHGGVDLQILGLGINGHIGFNEPGSSFQSTTHIVQLTNSTRQANARYFNDLTEVPTHAITMGIGTIMKSKQILLLVSGEGKKAAVNRFLQGKVNKDFPASILTQHPYVTIIADEEALQDVKSIGPTIEGAPYAK
jgi:glucosamine-6-phosphate deaminase